MARIVLIIFSRALSYGCSFLTVRYYLIKEQFGVIFITFSNSVNSRLNFALLLIFNRAPLITYICMWHGTCFLCRLSPMQLTIHQCRAIFCNSPNVPNILTFYTMILMHPMHLQTLDTGNKGDTS